MLGVFFQAFFVLVHLGISKWHSSEKPNKDQITIPNLLVQNGVSSQLSIWDYIKNSGKKLTGFVMKIWLAVWSHKRASGFI